MKTYLLDIIPKIKQFSKKLDDTTNLTGKHWILFNKESEDKVVYIFKKDNELLLLKNGKGTNEKWELIDEETIQITIDKDVFLFKVGFLDNIILALTLDDDIEEYSVFGNKKDIS